MVQTCRRGRHSLFSNMGREICWQCKHVPSKSRLVLRRGQIWAECCMGRGSSCNLVREGLRRGMVESKKESPVRVHYSKTSMVEQISLKQIRRRVLLLKGYLPWGRLTRHTCQMEMDVWNIPKCSDGGHYHIWWQFHSCNGQMPKWNITLRHNSHSNVVT